MEKGFVIWFTGIPASGKSTLASAVQERVKEMGLPVENLDADEVRVHQPYEAPKNGEVHITTSEASVEDCAAAVMTKLGELGYLPADN